VAPKKVLAKGVGTPREHTSCTIVVSAKDKEKNVCAGTKRGASLFVVGSHISHVSRRSDMNRSGLFHRTEPFCYIIIPQGRVVCLMVHIPCFLLGAISNACGLILAPLININMGYGLEFG
jgi:hypothetical protein